MRRRDHLQVHFIGDKVRFSRRKRAVARAPFGPPLGSEKRNKNECFDQAFGGRY